MPLRLLKPTFGTIFRRTPPQAFLRWANTDEAEGPPDLIVYGRPERANPRAGQVPENTRFIADPDELRNELLQQQNALRDLHITDRLPADSEITRLLCFEERSRRDKVHLHHLRIGGDVLLHRDFDLCNMAIRRMVLRGRLKGALHISNCWLEVFAMSGPDIDIDLNIQNSHIAHLNLVHSRIRTCSIKDLSIASGEIGGDRQVFIGDVLVHGLRTPRGPSWYEKTCPSPDKWHRIKRDLVRGGNEWAAGLFHATEVSIRSREDPSRIVRWIGRFYEHSCDYGNSVAQPLMWLLCLFLTSLNFYFVWEMIAPSWILDHASCVGWMKSVCQEGDGTTLIGRALYFAAQPLLNPLAGVMGSSLLIPELPAYVWSIFQRIMSFVLLF